MDLESRILDLAARRGLLPGPPVDAPSPGPDSGSAERLRALVDQGVLSPDLVQALRWEAERRDRLEAPACPDSWVLDSLEAGVDLPPGDPVPTERYRDLAPLGSGGAGRVYRAFDTVLHREVALKFPRTGGPAQRERWLREARAQAQVEHPHVCKVFEVGEAGGQPFIAMELVDGLTLSRAAAGLSVREKAALVRDAAEAVHAAHRRGLLHLDLKPGNILLAKRTDGGNGAGWHALVTDFGFHQVEGEAPAGGPAPGTPPFSSPEQQRGGPVDRRSDVYALGMTLRALLSDAPGGLPGPPAPGTPEDLCAVVRRCLERNPEDRYVSALDLAEDLQRFLDGLPVRARPATAAYRLRRWTGRHRALAAALGISALLLAGLGAWSALAQLRTRRQAQRAQALLEWAQDVEVGLGRARSAPLHDLSPMLRKVDAGLKDMEAEAARAPRDLRPVADYARGRVLRLLGRDRAAERILRRSWDAGYRTPQAAFDLGQVLVRRYFQEALALRRIEDPGRRSEALARLDRERRQEALRTLAAAREGGGQALYLDAAQALLEGRYPEAVAQGQRFLAEVPWATEGHLVVAEAWQAQAEQREAARDGAGAEAAWAEAERVLQAAVDVDRSDPEAYARLGRFRLRRHTSHGQTADPGLPWVQALAADLERGLRTDPSHPGLLALKAHLDFADAYARLTRGGADPLAPLHAARREAEAALAAEPEDGMALTTRAGTLALEATYLSRRGDGAGSRPLLEQSLEIQARAAALQPELAYPHAGMAVAYEQLGALARDRGEDSRPWVRKGYEEARISCDMAPTQAMRAGMMLVFAAELVDEDVAFGQDPAADLALAREAMDRTRGTLEGMHVYVKDRGRVAHLQALWAWRRGQDPAPHLAAARKDLERAHALQPAYLDTTLFLGQLELLEARVAGPAGARRHLEAAARLFEAAAKQAPDDLNPLMALGDLGRCAAELVPGSPWASRGEASLRALLARRPALPEAEAALAALEVHGGAAGARERLRRVLDAAPRLRVEYGRYLG